MEEKTNDLKQVLLEQLSKTRELSEDIIKELEIPRYTSGRAMKDGDKPLHILETVKNAEIPLLKMIILHPEEIDEYCQEYDYVKGQSNTIIAVRKELV